MIIFKLALNTKLTLLVSGHVEPLYDSSIEYSILAGTGIENGNWVVNFVCMSSSSKIITRVGMIPNLIIYLRP